MGKELDLQDALRRVKGNGNSISGNTIYVKAARLEKDGIPGVTSVGIKAWGALDYLKRHGYRVVYEVGGSGKRDRSED